jgi:hypothetical protein
MSALAQRIGTLMPLYDLPVLAFPGMTLPTPRRSVFQGRTQGTAPRSISSMMARVTFS